MHLLEPVPNFGREVNVSDSQDAEMSKLHINPLPTNDAYMRHGLP